MQVAVAIDHVPVLVGNRPVLVSHPADVTVLDETCCPRKPACGADSAKFLNDAGKVVNVLGAACAIKAEFHEFTVLLAPFVQLRDAVCPYSVNCSAPNGVFRQAAGLVTGWSCEPVIEHEVDEHTRDRDVKPKRERPARDRPVFVKALAQGLVQGNDH